MAAGLVIPKGTLFTGLAETFRYVDSNVTLTAYDLVNIQSGQLEVADGGERIAGYVAQTGTITSSSTGVAVNVTPFMQIVMDNDNIAATFAATDVGKAFDIIGATGAQLIDTSTGVGLEVTTQSAQVTCLEFNPQGVRDDLNTDTSVGLFMVREHQFSNV